MIQSTSENLDFELARLDALSSMIQSREIRTVANRSHADTVPLGRTRQVDRDVVFVCLICKCELFTEDVVQDLAICLDCRRRLADLKPVMIKQDRQNELWVSKDGSAGFY